MSRYQRRQPDDIYAQILCKFIVNLPKAELEPQRIWFHYEKAFYYYLDHEKNKHNKSIKQTDAESKSQQLYFFQKLNRIAPAGFRYDPTNLIEWIGYFYDNIPVYGAILINEKRTRMVCVQSKANKLGFPKGKIDQGQTPVTCAVREVWEETGYDISDKINENQFIKVEGDTKNTIFFVVKNIKEQTVIFKTQAESEVERVIWVPIDEQGLPFNKVTRNALKKLPALLSKQPKASKSLFETFLENFKLEWSKDVEPPKENPFTNFRFDREKLLSIFR